MFSYIELFHPQMESEIRSLRYELDSRNDISYHYVRHVQIIRYIEIFYLTIFINRWKVKSGRSDTN